MVICLRTGYKLVSADKVIHFLKHQPKGSYIYLCDLGADVFMLEEVRDEGLRMREALI